MKFFLVLSLVLLFSFCCVALLCSTTLLNNKYNIPLRSYAGYVWKSCQQLIVA